MIKEKTDRHRVSLVNCGVKITVTLVRIIFFVNQVKKQENRMFTLILAVNSYIFVCVIVMFILSFFVPHYIFTSVLLQRIEINT